MNMYLSVIYMIIILNRELSDHPVQIFILKQLKNHATDWLPCLPLLSAGLLHQVGTDYNCKSQTTHQNASRRVWLFAHQGQHALYLPLNPNSAS